ncbi:MAG: RseA family anti-sigma factor [Rhodocyclaceae bacterium]
MKSEVSALMDDALESATGERLCDRLGRDPELRRAWSQYHLVGDVLRGTPDCAFDVTAQVLSRLADEPTALSQFRKMRGREPSRWSRYVMPLAASVMGIGAVGWVAQTLNAPSEVSLAVSGAPAVVVPRANDSFAVSTAPPDIIEPAKVSQVRQYLFVHQGYSLESSIQGVAPYVRTVSDEREGGAR